MRRKSLLLIVIIATLFYGCINKEIQSKNREAEFIYLLIMLDGTGSYEYVEKAKRSAAYILRDMPGIKRVALRWITDNSILDKNSIAAAEFLDEVSIKNPFNLQGKNLKKQANVINMQKKEKLIKVLLNAPSPKSPRTDIYGALAAASARFEGIEPLKPVLILFTDMQDNVRKRNYKINLHGAAVKIMDFQIGDDLDKIKAYWSKFLMSHGASSVEFKYLDDPKGGV